MTLEDDFAAIVGRLDDPPQVTETLRVDGKTFTRYQTEWTVTWVEEVTKDAGKA